MSLLPKRQDEEHFVLGYPVFLKIVVTLGVLFFGLFFVVGMGDCFYGQDNFSGMDMPTAICYALFTAFYLFSFMYICVWRVEIAGEYITCIGVMGKRKQYHASEITRAAEFEGGFGCCKTVAYHGNRPLFTIDEKLPGSYLFTAWCGRRGIPLSRLSRKAGSLSDAGRDPRAKLFALISGAVFMLLALAFLRSAMIWAAGWGPAEGVEQIQRFFAIISSVLFVLGCAGLGLFILLQKKNRQLLYASVILTMAYSTDFSWWGDILELLPVFASLSLAALFFLRLYPGASLFPQAARALAFLPGLLYLVYLPFQIYEGAALNVLTGLTFAVSMLTAGLWVLYSGEYED